MLGVEGQVIQVGTEPLEPVQVRLQKMQVLAIQLLQVEIQEQARVLGVERMLGEVQARQHLGGLEGDPPVLRPGRDVDLLGRNVGHGQLRAQRQPGKNSEGQNARPIVLNHGFQVGKG